MDISKSDNIILIVVEEKVLTFLATHHEECIV